MFQMLKAKVITDWHTDLHQVPSMLVIYAVERPEVAARTARLYRA